MQRTGAASPVPRPSPAQAVKAKRRSSIHGGSFSGIQQSIVELPLPMQRTNSSITLSTGIMRSPVHINVKMPQTRRSSAIAIMTSQQQSQIQDAANEDNRPVHRYSTRMNVFSLLLLALALVNIAIVTLNTDTRTPKIFQEQQKEQQQSRRRRHLVEETTCKLFFKDTEYAPTPTQPHGHSRVEYVCRLPQEESSRLGGLRYLDIVDFENTVSVSSSSNSRTSTTTRPTLISGESTMTISQAIVDIEEPKLYIPHDAVVEVQTTKTRNLQRNLIAKTGTFTTLVIRVIDSNGVEPEPSLAKMENDVFQDDVSLKTQYEKCSYGKLQIEPFSGKTSTGTQINGGVVDVKVDFELTATNNNRGALQQAAFEAAKVQLGDLDEKVNDDDIYDLVLFCMPPGTGDWLAYAFINDKYTFYNNQWCSSVSAQMHEVGHNMGLAHSGQAGKGDEKDGTYDDQQGMMGSSYNQDDTNMCFNPAKSFQLGWYDNKVQTIDPLSNDAEVGVGDSGSRLFTLNGVSDYQQKPNVNLVVLRLEQTSSELEKDFYIGYNRKDGINKDTTEDGNMITIVRKESGLPTEYGQSTKVAELFLGRSHVIPNFNGEENRHVEVKFVGLLNGDATIEVIDVENYAPIDYGPCATYTIELTTDNYPDDNTWSIAENGGIGRAVAISPTYTLAGTKYITNVCLPYKANYKFVILDAYKDGLCCSQGSGSYRGLDPEGNELFGGSETNFESEEHSIVVGDNPNKLPPTSSPTSSPTLSTSEKLCIDKQGRFKWNPKSKKKRNCAWIAKKNKRCKKKLNGEQLWRICPNACNRCADL